VKSLTLALPLTLALTSPTRADEFLRRHAETRGFNLGRPVSPKPTPDGKAVLFLRSPAREPVQSLYEFDVATGQTRALLAAADLLKGGDEKLSPEERARRERLRLSTRGLSGFQLSEDGTRLLLPLSGRLYLFERATGKVTDLAAGAEAHLSPDGQRVAYVRDRDVYVTELATKKETRLTHSPKASIGYGTPEFVAQEEMDRFDGMWWSPDSRSLAIEEVDSQPVETFHLMDLLHPESEPESVPYPRAGTNNAKVRLAVISALGGTMKFVDWDAIKFPYLATVRWKDGPLTFAVIDRAQQNLELRLADEKSGKSTQLLTEHDDQWINLDQSVPRWLSDKSGFLWSSERSGTRALELHDARGKLQHSFADLAYDGLLHLHDRTAWVRTAASPLDVQIARQPLTAGAAAVPLSSGEGLHEAAFSEDGSLMVLRTAATNATPKWEVIRDGKLVGTLPSVADEPPFLPKQEFFVVGDRKLNAVVVKPRNFAAGKKYPVVLEVYGGPHHQQVQHTLRPALLRQWYADHGFVVVAIDGRGTPHRGRDWERAIRGDFTVTLEDQVAGLKALGAKLPYLDLKRTGVFGWSFGGWLAGLATLSRPDVFATGIAGAPVVDWHDYDTFYTERYLGLPSDKAAYDKSSLLTYAGKLERPLLIVHGTRDDNVYFMNSLKLADALFRAGKRFSLLPLSGLTHMVPDPTVTERLHERIAAELAAGLK
jgi:dipeptidyl-peptidase-4